MGVNELEKSSGIILIEYLGSIEERVISIF